MVSAAVAAARAVQRKNWRVCNRGPQIYDGASCGLLQHDREVTHGRAPHNVDLPLGIHVGLRLAPGLRREIHHVSIDGRVGLVRTQGAGDWETLLNSKRSISYGGCTLYAMIVHGSSGLTLNSHTAS